MPARKKHRRRRKLPEDAFGAFEEGNARAWNAWRAGHPEEVVDLRGLRGPEPAPGTWLRHFDLRGADLRGVRFAGGDLGHVDLRGARLDGADLKGAMLVGADCREVDFGEVTLDRADLRRANLAGARFKSGAGLRGANLERANCREVVLEGASLRGANLSRANATGARMKGASLERADLSETVLDGADLRRAELRRAVLYHTSLKGADLRGATVVDTFVRGVEIDDATQQKGLLGGLKLWFTAEGGIETSAQHVDDLRAASLLSLLGERGAITSLVNAGSGAVVLILGRFGRRRLAILRRLAEVLRTKGRIPIIFDFPGPEDRELSDTVRLLATLSEFLIVDLSDPRSVPLELQATIPGLMIPVVPIIEAKKRVFAMFQDLQRRYFWVLPPASYTDKADLAAHVESGILKRMRRVQRQIERRRQELAESGTSISSFGPAEAVDPSIDWIG